MAEYAIVVENLRFAWPELPDHVLHIPQFAIRKGQHAFVHGQSGCGKSTFLALLAGVLRPQEGHIAVAGIRPVTDAGFSRLRADSIGIVFQQLNILPYLSVVDNVLLSCDFSARRRDNAGTHPRCEAQRLLLRMGLDEALWSRSVSHLSVGQQQRVAVARALLGSPAIVLADEPSSSLDQENAGKLVELLLEEAEATGATVLMASHDLQWSSRFVKVLAFEDIAERGMNACAA